MKYRVHTKIKFPEFANPKMVVFREHEELIWLRTRLEENEQFTGLTVSLRFLLVLL